MRHLIGKTSRSRGVKKLLEDLGDDYLEDTVEYAIYLPYDGSDWKVDTVVNEYERHYPNDGIKLVIVDTKGLTRIDILPPYQGTSIIPIRRSLDYDTFNSLTRDWVYEGENTMTWRDGDSVMELYYRHYVDNGPNGDDHIDHYEASRLTIK